MKKLFFFGALLAGALAFNACSSNDDVADGTSQGNDVGDGDAFVSLAINLPTDNSGITRGENDVFSDGLATEYAVNNVTLLFFDGTTTSSKLLAKYTPTTTWNRVGTSIDNVTSIASIVQQIDNKLKNTPMYLLVILNDASSITYSTTSGSETTLNDVINATVNSNSAITAGSMMMVNAPLSKAPGKTTEPTSADLLTLVPIATTQIYTTEAEAKANPAAQVYVERLASKVTVNAPAGNTTNGTLPYTVMGWALDNYNTQSYLMRSTDDYASFYNYYSDVSSVSTKKYRMVGSEAVGKNYNESETYYRIYFAKDQNYDGTGSVSLTTSTSPTFKTSFGEANPAYCFENTFNVANQLYKNTTRVVFKVQFNSGNDFYTLDGNGSTIYQTGTGTNSLDLKLKELLANETAVKDWIDANNNKGLGNAGKTFADAVTITVAAKSGSTTEYEVTGVTLTPGNLFNTSAAGYVALDATYTDDKLKEVLNSAAGSITFYDDGIAYYDSRIKHFGDELTPWAETDHLTTGAYDDEGTAPVSRYLGRWGMLRNNWYDLNVTSIKQVGSATVPDVSADTTTDDVVNAYISVKINILSWAKRTQNIGL